MSQSTPARTKVKKKQEATVKSLNSKGRFPRKSLGQDPYMAAIVKEHFAGTNMVKFLQEDFTRCRIHSHMSSILQDRSSAQTRSRHAKVVANIPFNISKNIVKQLLPMGDIFSVAVLLQQVKSTPCSPR